MTKLFSLRWIGVFALTAVRAQEAAENRLLARSSQTSDTAPTAGCRGDHSGEDVFVSPDRRFDGRWYSARHRWAPPTYRQSADIGERIGVIKSSRRLAMMTVIKATPMLSWCHRPERGFDINRKHQQRRASDGNFDSWVCTAFSAPSPHQTRQQASRMTGAIPQAKDKTTTPSLSSQRTR